MAQRLDIDQTNAALAALLARVMNAAYGNTVDVKESSVNDFDDDGQLVLPKIGIRVRFGQAEYGAARDISRTTKSATLVYEIVCRHESLRSKAETRNRTLQLITCVQEQLAGARIVLDNGTKSEPIDLVNVLPVSDKFGPVEDCYALTVEVSGFAQYAGVNATPLGGA